jgi:hypothetical protein
MFHRDSGSVVAVDNVNNLTTYVITTTRVDRRPSTSATSTDDYRDDTTTAIPTLAPSRSRYWLPANDMGQPSTITQGPATFMFTGTRFGPDHTVYFCPPPFFSNAHIILTPSPGVRVNHCSLNGTANAACNLTHVGSAWYTRHRPEWNGTYSTYSYNWTSGDSFGFAPVTITEGAELLTGPDPTPRGTPSGGAVLRSPAAVWVGLVGVVVVALGVGVGL